MEQCWAQWWLLHDLKYMPMTLFKWESSSLAGHVILTGSLFSLPLFLLFLEKRLPA
jgi:hypothetical protein